MDISLEDPNEQRLSETLRWLAEEDAKGRDGFHCNRNTITALFREGTAVCAVLEGRVVGFAVFEFYGAGDRGASLSIIEVHPEYRRHGIGRRLIDGVVERVRCMGARFVEVECVKAAGECLCKCCGFEGYVDPRNHADSFEGPLMRLYLTDWRPQRQPWDR